MISRAMLPLFAFLASAALVIAETLPDDWAFRPLRRAPLPSPALVAGASRPSANLIDLFIQAKLAEKGLKPGTEADRHTLLRRVCFDLIGLPPAPEEVEAWY
jgi:hypothetical protein